jgi:hypothetical protein
MPAERGLKMGEVREQLEELKRQRDGITRKIEALMSAVDQEWMGAIVVYKGSNYTADQLLTENVRKDLRAMIVDMFCGRVGVWLKGSKRHDDPDGLGDSVVEALENAAYKLEMAARKGKA